MFPVMWDRISIPEDEVMVGSGSGFLNLSGRQVGPTEFARLCTRLAAEARVLGGDGIGAQIRVYFGGCWKRKRVWSGGKSGRWEARSSFFWSKGKRAGTVVITGLGNGPRRKGLKLIPADEVDR